ncbi:hypothetical protein LTR28_013820, partial [Elasticomyces elasticus]
MVLCPYVFLLTRHDVPPLRLQPTEVASTHWVSLRALLSPAQRTVSYEDVSNRLANQETGVKRWMLRAMLGQMLFAAIRLVPSESLYCGTTPSNLQQDYGDTMYKKRSFLTSYLRKGFTPVPQDTPLLLWGLTLGVMADFLDLLPPHDALALWTYPTFTPWDVRLTIWAMSYGFKARKRSEIQRGHASGPPAAAVEEGLDAVAVPAVMQGMSSEVGLGGLGSGVERRDGNGYRSSAVGTMLEGYYDI